MRTIAEIVMDSPIFGRPRQPISRDDFGDAGTVGLNLKRKGKTITTFEDHDFGVFLGEHQEGWIVGTMEVMSFRPTRIEAFETLEQLKEAWELD